ncbi:MAG: Gfo/Idh/MocA family oxidoreductase [Thermomicrobiales bacterium]|nr:Gfo/Idh/MocA family oxidoreductase [Thermomicrobiales bacterium]
MTASLRTVVAGLEHYHVTGWAETLGLFPDRIEVVGRFDPDSTRADRDRPAFVDPHLPESFPAWFQQVPFYADLDRMLRDTRPDLAMVTLPNRIAPDAIVALTQAGCHVITDKPGALDAAGAGRAVDAARANGVKLAVAFTRRYGRPWQQVASEIARGRLGHILSSEAIFVTSSIPVRDPANPIFDREAMGGGILHWLGIHDIDLIQWLSGESIISVQAMAATMSASAVNVEDTISIQFRLSGGAVGTMHFAYALPRPGGAGSFALRGTDAAVTIDAAGTTEWIGPGSIANPLQSEQLTSDVVRLPGYGSAGAAIVSDMLDAIARDRGPLDPGENARDALRVVDAAYESARTGRAVDIDPENNLR